MVRFLPILIFLSFVASGEAKSAATGTCGEFFDNHGGNDFCIRRGFTHSDPRDKLCHGAKCGQNKCCYNTKQIETCGEFFKRTPNNICQSNGYQKHRSNEKECKDGGCTVDLCCKKHIPTCYDFFSRHGEHTCQKNGYKGKAHNYANKKGNDLDSCCDEKKLEPPTTCGDFFATKHAHFCQMKGYRRQRSNKKICLHDRCNAKQCCRGNGHNRKNNKTIYRYVTKNQIINRDNSGGNADNKIVVNNNYNDSNDKHDDNHHHDHNNVDNKNQIVNRDNNEGHVDNKIVDHQREGENQIVNRNNDGGSHENKIVVN